MTVQGGADLFFTDIASTRTLAPSSALHLMMYCLSLSSKVVALERSGKDCFALGDQQCMDLVQPASRVEVDHDSGVRNRVREHWMVAGQETDNAQVREVVMCLANDRRRDLKGGRTADQEKLKFFTLKTVDRSFGPAG